MNSDLFDLIKNPCQIRVMAGRRRRWWSPWRTELFYTTVFSGIISTVTRENPGLITVLVVTDLRERR